jgi:hypothetical protein
VFKPLKTPKIARQTNLRSIYIDNFVAYRELALKFHPGNVCCVTFVCLMVVVVVVVVFFLRAQTDCPR